MAQPLNTFAVVLLAFPFYLAQKGRLVGYIDLAKPGKTAAASTAAPVADATPEAKTGQMDTASLMQVFSDTSALFT